MPQDLETAIAALGTGHRHRIDVGDVNGRTFLNNAAIGLYPRIVLDREQQRRQSGLPKYLAHILSTIRILAKFPIYRLRLSTPGLHAVLKSPGVFVGNNIYRLDPIGFGRRECLDGGVLGVIVIRCRTWLGVVALGLRALFGGLASAKNCDTYILETINIDTRSRRLRVALDGEVMTLRPPLRFRCRPAVLEVIAPDRDKYPTGLPLTGLEKLLPIGSTGPTPESADESVDTASKPR
jgi:diacylglycerol kinase family enzyme